ncbi:MAG: peptidoglycan -binding protein [Alphaproteobacteria bacterium]
MAIARRSRQQTLDIWPGFVDALATLLMVIIFLLMIFVISQLYLNDALAGRDKALDRLSRQVTELGELLALERSANDDLRQNVESISSQLRASLSRRDELEAALGDLRAERDGLLARFQASQDANEELSTKLSETQKAFEEATAALSSSRQELEDAYATIDADKETIQAQLAELDRLSSDIEALDALRQELLETVAAQEESLESTQSELTEEKEAALLARAEAAKLNQQIEALREQIADLNALLDASEERDREAEAQIADLGKRLNVALASKVQELARYRSEFFGKLREILGNRRDIQIVGDRFVFQSEVLFEGGSAELGEAGKEQMASLAKTLLEIATQIPPELNWILRVDGHTDERPISTARFPSNWELSTARAISVVKFLRSQGIPPERLAATGFAEYQPLDERTDEIAFRRNRRIELKLTER